MLIVPQIQELLVGSPPRSYTRLRYFNSDPTFPPTQFRYFGPLDAFSTRLTLRAHLIPAARPGECGGEGKEVFEKGAENALRFIQSHSNPILLTVLGQVLGNAL